MTLKELLKTEKRLQRKIDLFEDKNNYFILNLRDYICVEPKFGYEFEILHGTKTSPLSIIFNKKGYSLKKLEKEAINAIKAIKQ